MALTTHENALLLGASGATTYRANRNGDSFTIKWHDNFRQFTADDAPDTQDIGTLGALFGEYYPDWLAQLHAAMRDISSLTWEHTLSAASGCITVRHVIIGLSENTAIGAFSVLSSSPDVISDDIKLNILEYLPIGVYFIDYDFRIQWTNHLGTCQSHINWKEHYGNICYKDPFGLGSPCEVCPVRQTFVDGKPYSVERKMPNGATWLISSIPAQDHTGKQIGAIETVIDVSEIAEERERSWQMLSAQQAQLASQLDSIKQLHSLYIKEGRWLLDSPGVITETMARTMHCDSVRFWLHDDNKFTLLDQYDAAAETHPAIQSVPAFLLDFLKELVAGQGQILIPDIANAGLPSDITAYYAANGVNALLVSPLTTNKELLGIITAANRESTEWKVDEQSFAMALADAVVLSLNQQRLVEKQRQLDTLMANLPGMAFRMRFNANGPELEYVSDGCRELTGFFIGDLEGNRDAVKRLIFADDYQQYIEAHTSQRAMDATIEVLFRLDLGEGNLRWVLERSKVIAVEDAGQTIIFEGFAHDISERMKLKEAELASEAKSNFLAAMSHEIRTPLNAIIGFTHFIRQTQMTAQQTEYLTKIDTSATILLELINTILDFSKIEAGKMELLHEPFRLDDLLSGLESVFHGQVEEKGLTMTFTADDNVPRELVGSSLHLKQVLLNLISNAVKFTEKGSISVTCELTGQKDGFVDLKFSVSDTGMGMTREDLDKVFNAFVQADDSVSRRHGGTGLGLSIAKSLVELMHGEISAASTFGRGTVFTFTCRVRVNTAPVGSRNNDKYQPPHFKGQPVLLVEDNEINREIALTMLEDVNLTVTTAENGREALEILEHAPTDAFKLILMDIQMPVMDGLQATRRIRSMPGMDEIPIIAMTAHALDTERKKSKAAGMNGHLSKPIEVKDFYDTLAQYLATD